jgi:hypothetical protein
MRSVDGLVKRCLVGGVAVGLIGRLRHGDSGEVGSEVTSVRFPGNREGEIFSSTEEADIAIDGLRSEVARTSGAGLLNSLEEAISMSGVGGLG